MTRSVDANQPPPLAGYNLFTADRALTEAVSLVAPDLRHDDLIELGERAGSPEVIEWGFLADRHPPGLRTHDRFGDRIDEVDFHPAWHELLEQAVTAGLHGYPWVDNGPGSHVRRAAGFGMVTQVEAGHGCPLSMTYAAIPALRTEPALARVWEPRLTERRYERRFATGKPTALVGMAMTERQGGSDLRTNTTAARRLVEEGAYALDGQKWFCSAPMSDAFLVLAQAEGGMTCFLVPRWTPYGERNGFHLVRLKDKLGNRGNASAEIELRSAFGWRVGEEGRGIATILDMVQHTRLDCLVGSAAGIRQAVVQAIHHAAHRRAFGRLLIDQPLMGAVLTDLALESEAATWLAIRLASSFGTDDQRDAAFRRIATPIAKYWVCKRHPLAVAEALECLGGNGFVEESIMPRLFRESPLNSIWEGSGNVICLDVLRAARRHPDSVEALFDELEAATGVDRRYDEYVDALRAELRGAGEADGRRVVGRLALALQASLLIRYSPLAEAFVAGRLASDWNGMFGHARPADGSIVARAWPPAA